MTTPSRPAPSRRGLRVLLALGLSASLVLCDAWAQGRPPPPPPGGGRPVPARQVPAPSDQAAKKARVEVMVVYATNTGNRVDADLQPIMQQLKFTSFRSFTHLESHPAELAVGEESTFGIAGGRRVKIALISRDDKQAKIRMQMFSQGSKLLDTTVSIHRDRSFMVAGPRYQEGVLILPITVSY